MHTFGIFADSSGMSCRLDHLKILYTHVGNSCSYPSSHDSFSAPSPLSVVCPAPTARVLAVL
jgi:hypothetical protein